MVLAVITGIISAGATAQVELRGGMLVSAPVINISIEGVEVGGDEPRVIGWDSVKLVLGDRADEAAPFAALAEQAWRARLRLSRGDIELACPLFDDLFRTYRGLSGPTAVMVAEGRVRCMLRQGDQTGAITPWLEALRLRRAGFTIAGDPPVTPVLDEDTGLIPALPPIWLGTADVAALADFQPSPALDGVALGMAVIYREAARFESGRDLSPLTQEPHPGLELARLIVLSRAGDASQRAAARAKLSSGLEADANTWREAWRRAAIGRSLLREESIDDRTAGVFQLLHLPARFAQTQPYLAALCLADAALEMHRRGDAASASVLAQELRSLAPDGPADLWLRNRLEQTPVTQSGPAPAAASTP